MDDDQSVDEGGHRVLDVHGRILRDNLYGTIEEDVWRRDFTANALYYNIADYSIWDYVGGVPDAQARVLRLIGDPETRYREDPVRMLRAARFAAKLDFTLHPDTGAPLERLAYMLDSVPPARLFDETLKLMLAGNAAASFGLLRRFGLLGHLMPDVARAVAEAPDAPGARLLDLGLANTDERVRADRSVTPTFLFAVLLWPAILRAAGTPAGPLPQDLHAVATACDAVLARQLRRITVPKRFTLPMRDMVLLQPRFENRAGRRALRLLGHPKFRAAYDFLLLRAASGEVDPELAAWWTRLQELPEVERVAQVENRPAGEEGDAGQQRTRSRRRRRRRPASA
jgi:poly(A) polymerase